MPAPCPEGSCSEAPKAEKDQAGPGHRAPPGHGGHRFGDHQGGFKQLLVVQGEDQLPTTWSLSRGAARVGFSAAGKTGSDSACHSLREQAHRAADAGNIPAGKTAAKPRAAAMSTPVGLADILTGNGRPLHDFVGFHQLQPYVVGKPALQQPNRIQPAPVFLR